MITGRNLVLTGFMATGKSTVGRLVAERLGMEFVDTDLVISKRHGPIPSIFESLGEEGFRAIERSLAAELGARIGLVIATGGKLILDPENLSALGRRGAIFCLVAEPEEILRRVTAEGDPSNRPLLEGEDPRMRINQLLAERAPGYARFAQVETDGLSPEEVADEVMRLWERLV
jgi:shikimate kinase